MKKMINLLLATSHALSILPVSTLASKPVYFNDTNNHWGEEFINQAYEAKLMTGKGSGSFDPDGTITLAEFAVIVTNGAYNGEQRTSANDHWGGGYVTVLGYNSLTKDSSGNDVIGNQSATNTALYDEPITREDVVTVIARLLAKKGMTPANLSTYNSMTDLNRLKNGSFQSGTNIIDATQGQYQDIVTVMSAGIMSGKTPTEFGIGDYITRGEMCVIITNLLNKGVFTARDTSSNSSSNSTTTTPPVTTTPSDTSSNTTTTTPSTTPSTTSKPADVVLGSGQYNVSQYTVPADTNKDGWITYAEVEAVMTRLQKEYPDGMTWTNDNSYKFFGTYSTDTNNYGGTAYGCAAFAMLVSDEIFGNLPIRRVIGDLSLDPREQIRPGDVYYSSAIGHWGVIMGDYPDLPGVYASADGNSNGTVSWYLSGTYEKAQNNIVTKTDILYSYTRYPAA